MNAILLGGIAAIPSYPTLQLRAKTSLDDSLDVLAAHGVGGTVGALLTGVFAEKALNTVADGALYGNPRQLLVQLAAVMAALFYSAAMSFVLLKLINLVVPIRAAMSDEMEGLDVHAARTRRPVSPKPSAKADLRRSGPVLRRTSSCRWSASFSLFRAFLSLLARAALT